MVQAGSTSEATDGGLAALRSAPAAFLERDAATEGLSRPLVWTLVWLPLVSLAGLLAIAALYRPAFDRLLQEDYPVEWAQFAFCLFICVVCLMAVRPALRDGHRLLAALLVLAGVGFFFLAGEEISWAQRVFGIATPADFAGNDQDEMNLHNFTGGFDPEALFRGVQLLISLTMAAVAVYGRLGPVRKLGSESFWRIVAPPLCTLPLLASQPGYRVYRLFTPGDGSNFAVRLQEWAEFCQYAGLSVAAVCIYFALQPETELVGSQARHAVRASDDREWRRLRLPAVLIILLTLIFAAMTEFSGVTAGNAL
jgi:uncharacterized membrane protein